MRKIICALAVMLLLPAFSLKAGKIITDSVQSQILGSEVKYNVYLPDGFDKSEKQYPVVYLLHGLYGTYQDWEQKGTMKEVADELIRSGEAVEMVIVMPNAGDPDIHNVYNGYFNMPNWNYEDFFFKEFIPAVEKKYRGIGDKGHRAVMGLSMGGGGSTVYAQRHPDMFSSCYAMSAWLDQQINPNTPEEKKDKFYYTCKAVREALPRQSPTLPRGLKGGNPLCVEIFLEKRSFPPECLSCFSTTSKVDPENNGVHVSSQG